MNVSITHPANFPTGDRRTSLVLLPVRRPSTVPGVLLRAAQILQANGLWQGDYVPDPLDREVCVPHFLRPMSVIAALNCAATGDPHRTSQVSDMAMGFVALSIDGGPYWTDFRSLEAHVEAWNDAEGRSADEAVALLELLATTSERAA
ncbi:hypothetical protein ACFQ67_00330 [Streptomyces sp. NPDC056488]|uniref:DUF6197 family protein n=1 Tax=Streptomyces sp. NPDC056488 TaxID=3345836 RepID=UPI003696D604